MDFSISDAFSLANHVIKEKFKTLSLMFIVITALQIAAYYVLYDNATQLVKSFIGLPASELSVFDVYREIFSGTLILLLLVIIVVSVIFNAHLITLVKSTVLDPDDSFKSTLKGIWYYIGSSLLLGLAIVGIMIPFILIAFIPLLGILGLVAFIVILFYFIGVYRFVPYYAFIKRTFDGIFSEVKRHMSGHFWQSFGLIIIFALINLIVETAFGDMESLINKEQLVEGAIQPFAFGMIIGVIITSIVSYYQILVDISFITKLLDIENKQRELRERKRQEAISEVEVNDYVPPVTSNKNEDDFTPFKL